MAEVVVAFLWHQHQPYYPDDVAGENPMPWVRLHGVKDYYGMALHLQEVPQMHCTINLVPSLVQQLQSYTDHNGSDRFLDLTRKEAGDLSQEDSLFLLDQFFMANHEQMIRPFPRYYELLHRRAAGKNSALEALRRFREPDLRDLQVWFNLAWTHPLAIEKDRDLKNLVEKGRGFSEADKRLLLEKHLAILKQILPLHRQLAASGQVELTTTPYFHPILPLLLDKKAAREALPEMNLPRYTGGYPEDAALQVRRAVDQHTRVFGKPPEGMWPSEGSVSQAMIPLLKEYGIQWIATDEEILSASTHGFVHRDNKGNVHNPDRMYRPYRVKEGQAELNILFRDHYLSDLIGFHYQRSDPRQAADHFIQCLQGIGGSVHTSEPALVPVILDGENCWEHYPGGGVEFLRHLYQKCTQTPGIRPLGISDYLKRYPPHDTLPRLFAGSWISHNFSIWIGHSEDNTAWDALHRTREYLLKKAGEFAGRSSAKEAAVLEQAWEEIYIAEGSDWFWWFGDDHSSAQDGVFDYLFRKHLQNVYLLLGDQPPAELGRAINRKAHRIIHTHPRAFLDVKIDGNYTFFEWVGAGHYTCHNERGTMALALKGPIKDVYFGFNLDDLLIRIDFDEAAHLALEDFDQCRLVFVDPPGPVLVLSPLEKISAGIRVAVAKILEAAIPFELLGIAIDQSIQFYVEVVRVGQSLDRAPREGTLQTMRPSADFELVMWDV